MWLTYGVANDGALVEIEAAPRGKTSLRCPYCGQLLAAKKGQIKQAHFAHLETTCRAVERADADAPTLPLYDRFTLEFTGKELEALRLVERGGIPNQKMIRQLERRDLMHFNHYAARGRGAYELTKRGKIPLGDLSLRLFCDEQEPLIAQRLADLETAAEQARIDTSPLLDEHLADLRIYRAQLRRILSTRLYFLQVDIDGRTLYKIGVTTRTVEQRAAEVADELVQFYAGQGATRPTVRIIDTWSHRGNVELYFKHRYAAQQHPIGTLTEYYAFNDVAPVLRDLRRMPEKVLSETEQQILAGQPSAVEQAIANAQRAAIRAVERSKAIREGMQQAAEQGVHVGRPEGREDAARFLAKPTSQRVITYLDEGYTVRATARRAGVAINTVRKVQAARTQLRAVEE